MLSVVLHGHLGGGFGLSGGAFATRRLLLSVGCSVSLNDLPVPEHPPPHSFGDQVERAPKPRASASAQQARTQHQHQLDLVHTNPNMLAIRPDFKPASLTAPLRIGYWAWELETFPEGWESHFADYDEIWCPSAFTAQALSQRSPIPVVAIPHLPHWDHLDRLHQQRATRSQSDSRKQQPFRFLTAFDFWSTTERKNPLGVIQAFHQAFPPGLATPQPLELWIKTSSGKQFPSAYRALQAACAGDTRIRWIDGVVSQSALDHLLIEADAFVSLHRSEGFGLMLADAMAIGLPVIATGYSGNLDFMPPGSALLVPWSFAPIRQTCGDFRRGWHWAEPDLPAAAEAMQRLSTSLSLQKQLSSIGAATVRERLSEHRLASIVRQRLGTLLLQPSRRELLRNPTNTHASCASPN